MKGLDRRLHPVVGGQGLVKGLARRLHPVVGGQGLVKGLTEGYILQWVDKA